MHRKYRRGRMGVNSGPSAALGYAQPDGGTRLTRCLTRALPETSFSPGSIARFGIVARHCAIQDAAQKLNQPRRDRLVRRYWLWKTGDQRISWLRYPTVNGRSRRSKTIGSPLQASAKGKKPSPRQARSDASKCIMWASSRKPTEGRSGSPDRIEQTAKWSMSGCGRRCFASHFRNLGLAGPMSGGESGCESKSGNSPRSISEMASASGSAGLGFPRWSNSSTAVVPKGSLDCAGPRVMINQSSDPL